MKKALSIVLSVAMLLTVACSMFVVPASAADLPNSVNFLDESLIAEGAENITVNADGSWTITGSCAIAPNVTFDYAEHQYITLDMTVDSPFKITLLDRDPDGVYGDHWIGLHDNWVGPTYFPVGEFNATNSVQGIYNWNTQYSGWGNTGLATARAIYFEFESGTGSATIRTFNLNNGLGEYFFDADPEFETTKTFDLAIKDTEMWEQIPTSGSRVTLTVDGDTLTLGNTAGFWPSAYVDFADPIAVDPETAMVYADFSVAKGAKTTMYLFLGNTTATEFDSGAYVVVHDVFGAEVNGGTYKGYITLADLLPEGDAYDACFNEDGALLVTAVKLYATSEGEGAIDPAVTIRSLDLLYNEFVPEAPIELGDVDGNGMVDMMDAFMVYSASSTGAVPEGMVEIADMDGSGAIDMMDAFAVYRIASGQA